LQLIIIIIIVNSLDHVQNKAAKFEHHTERLDWEPLAQCRKKAPCMHYSKLIREKGRRKK
jgi:hypothetical protein